jgi:hypothetical protein
MPRIQRDVKLHRSHFRPVGEAIVHVAKESGLFDEGHRAVFVLFADDDRARRLLERAVRKSFRKERLGEPVFARSIPGRSRGAIVTLALRRGACATCSEPYKVISLDLRFFREGPTFVDLGGSPPAEPQVCPTCGSPDEDDGEESEDDFILDSLERLVV